MTYTDICLFRTNIQTLKKRNLFENKVTLSPHDSMEFIIDNVYTTINFTENKRFINYFEKELHKIIDPLDPDRYRKTAFRRHYWDGRIVFYDKKKKHNKISINQLKYGINSSCKSCKSSGKK